MAKYKAGDKVKVIGQGIETIVKVYPKGAGSGLLNTGGVDWYEMSGGGMITDEDIERVANACRNASFKVGDKVTYWVFDKKLNGSVKAVRGENVDIDDGHGGVVTFKAKDLEVWNAKACNSRNPIVAKAMNACRTAKNAVTITLDSRKRDGWVTGKVNGYDFEAKVFDEGSDFGIKSGRVSKLWMRKGDETVNYDRGWDQRPESAEAKAAYTELLRKMESLPKVMNACGTARNADGDIKPVEKEYTAAIRAVRELAVKAKSIDPRSRMYQDAVKAGTALYGGMKPNW